MTTMTEDEFNEHIKRPDRVPREVWFFPNGNVAVCDQHGQQMPELQGPWSEELEKRIRAAAHPHAVFHGRPTPPR